MMYLTVLLVIKEEERDLWFFKFSGQAMNHFFLLCSIVRELWLLVFALFGVQLVMPKKIVEVLFCWKGMFGCHNNSFIWNAVHFVLCRGEGNN
jgi:hypothetical protein